MTSSASAASPNPVASLRPTVQVLNILSLPCGCFRLALLDDAQDRWHAEQRPGGAVHRDEVAHQRRAGLARRIARLDRLGTDAQMAFEPAEGEGDGGGGGQH